MAKQAAILMLLGLLYLRVSFGASPINISNTDMSSLLALKSGFNSDILAKNWSRETPFCTWIGVTCGRRHPRVTALDLSDMDLEGSIGGEIGNLSFLTFLNVRNNSMSGRIPGEIGKLRRLRVLSLSSNYLSGDIPTSVSKCLQLKTLDLSFNNLTGNIPPSFENLSKLQQLELSGNQLTGELSSAIFNISSLLYLNVGENHLFGTLPIHICSQSAKLESLGLYLNQFEGEFPFAVTHCHLLKKLSLSQNKFRGNIPSEFWNLSALQWVALGGNKFTSTIPPSISNLTNLGVFSIMQNSFQGTIPSEIGLLSSLTILEVGTNKLNGEIPQSLFNCSSLQILTLGQNNLSGFLPSSIDKGLPNIARIYNSGNQFYGKIPNSISNLSKLTHLEISRNSFTGHIPINLGNLHQLQWLGLFGNQFTNNISAPEQDFLSSLGSSNYLKEIHISSNPITGSLPKSLGSSNLSASLQIFHAQYCKIISPIPDEIGNLSNLILLDLGHNEFTGPIPVALGNLRSLQALGMPGNKFRGSISDAMCNLGNLYYLSLGDNNLVGTFPRCFANLSRLREVYLADNALNFTIPSTSWLDEHIERLNISNNFLRGSIPVQIGNLKDLIDLDLSGNQLSGEIPSSVSQLQKLSTLSLSKNKLNGPILDSFVDLKDLQYLDLSRNLLSGPIPASLEKLANLDYLNVSFNELSGEIPDGGPFVNFTPEAFAGNKDLCGVPRFNVNACKRSKSSKKKLLKYILPVVALVLVVAAILIFVLRRRARKFLPLSLSDLPLVVMPERISYYEILRATNNLDEENLIGKGGFGSVYRGNFSDAIVAAVKVFDLDVQDALKSFDTECQILRNIRHRNLVKVVTSCSNLDFKALVMAYMPNGNLEKWLYSHNCSLDIFQTFGIMVDVASAVVYLHEGYTSSSIVHCDLKPNNILLDQDMIAHVGDFGIAKLLTQEQRMQQTRTLGTIGYIAPEYGSEGLVSTKVDVYSYGILLMEVFTKRRPTDEMFSGELTMRQWVSESFPNSVMQIVDRELLNTNDQRSRDGHERCLTSAIELAIECTSDLAEERPNMKDVVARMNKIKLNLSVRNH